MPFQKISLKAIIFDMDGVITNTMPEHYRAWQKVLKKKGIKASRLDIYSREGQRGIQSLREIFKKYDKPFRHKEALTILKTKERLFKRIVKRRFIPGSRNLIKGLFSRGFQLGLVTGTSRHEMNHILPQSLKKYFKVTITSNDVTHGKPHPEPYQKALKMLKLTPQEALVIENAPLGILSARKAGLRCLALETSLSKKYLTKTQGVFASIHDLRKKVYFRLDGKNQI